MGKTGAYLQIERRGHDVVREADAVQSFEEFARPLPRGDQREQASRCMNCGIAFCQAGFAFSGMRRAVGCPLHNLIPETNDLLYRGRWDEAATRLALTNPFPEFTGRVCPAPCETACNLGLHDAAVTIHDNERAISDYAWECGMEPFAAPAQDAPLVSVVGSGPAGLAAAWALAQAGVRVRVYERDDRPGGLLMYGIPNMKLPKDVVMRRVELMVRSGIEFRYHVDAAAQAQAIMANSAAVIVACGARVARSLEVEGSHLEGVHFAMEYLTEATKSLLEGRDAGITARGKDVVVIGGGDTAVDCLATALRQGARSVHQVVRAQSPASGLAACAWPAPREPYELPYGQCEALEVTGEDPCLWSTDTMGFCGEEGQVSQVRLASLGHGGRTCGEEFRIPAQLVLVAKGFVGPDASLLQAFGLDPASGEGATPFQAAPGRVLLAGDAHLGPSLVARAIADGLDVAGQVMGALSFPPAVCDE